MFRRSEQGGAAHDERAAAARNAATQAFLALDDEQRATAAAVDAADELGTGRRLGEAWTRVAALGDRATEAYLHASSSERPADRGADEAATVEIERAREAIRRFRASYARPLDEAAFLLQGLPRAVAEAQAALVAARAAVARGEQGEVRSRRATERLADAERSAGRLALPGLRERRDAAARTLELATSAAELAAEAPAVASRVRSALASVTTRRAAAGTRVARIAPALSDLRREFSEPCSRDLDDADARAGRALAAADAAVALAQRQAGEGDWESAADRITEARSELARAEERADAVTDRLSELRAVRADPAQVAEEARFVLRDAQRLVVDRGLVHVHGSALDAQSVRLQNARDRLTGTHPDYWLYLTELRGVQERARDVVSRVRAAAR